MDSIYIFCFLDRIDRIIGIFYFLIFRKKMRNAIRFQRRKIKLYCYTGGIFSSRLPLMVRNLLINPEKMHYKNPITSSIISDTSGNKASIIRPSLICLCCLNPNTGRCIALSYLNIRVPDLSWYWYA